MIPEPAKGLFQARCGDYILGYATTKAEAIKEATAHAKKWALEGSSRYDRWYVGLVVDLGTNTEFQKHQMGDGSGRMEGGYDRYDAVVTSTLAFGFATYKYSRTVAPKGSQGRSRR